MESTVWITMFPYPTNFILNQKKKKKKNPAKHSMKTQKSSNSKQALWNSNEGMITDQLQISLSVIIHKSKLRGISFWGSLTNKNNTSTPSSSFPLWNQWMSKTSKFKTDKYITYDINISCHKQNVHRINSLPLSSGQQKNLLIWDNPRLERIKSSTVLLLAKTQKAFSNSRWHAITRIPFCKLSLVPESGKKSNNLPHWTIEPTNNPNIITVEPLAKNNAHFCIHPGCLLGTVSLFQEADWPILWTGKVFWCK